jgi:hypothetical protein
MGISRAFFDAGKGIWQNSPFTDIQAGTTQIKKVMIDGVEVWNLGAFSAATIEDDGSGPIGLPNGTYTFNVASSTGSGTGGQITSAVVARQITTVSVVDGGKGHAIGDILTLEIVGASWFVDPEIEVTAL